MKSENDILKEGPIPSLETLFERHVGLYEPLCRAYADAAGVCFSRHHSPPSNLQINKQIEICTRKIDWQIPNKWGQVCC